MARRSPAYAERITVAARFVATPASHFTPLLTCIRDLGYFDPQRAAIVAIDEARAHHARPTIKREDGQETPRSNGSRHG